MRSVSIKYFLSFNLTSPQNNQLVSSKLFVIKKLSWHRVPQVLKFMFVASLNSRVLLLISLESTVLNFILNDCNLALWNSYSKLWKVSTVQNQLYSSALRVHIGLHSHASAIWCTFTRIKTLTQFMIRLRKEEQSLICLVLDHF